MITDYAIKCLLTYIKNGDSRDSGFFNYFDIGYVDGNNWVSVLTTKIRPRTVRFDDSTNPTKVICEGRISPSNIIVDTYSGIDFEIRMYDTESDDTCIAIVPMSDVVEEYFRTELSSTVEIMLQWEISFDRGE